MLRNLFYKIFNRFIFSWLFAIWVWYYTTVGYKKRKISLRHDYAKWINAHALSNYGLLTMSRLNESWDLFFIKNIKRDKNGDIFIERDTLIYLINNSKDDFDRFNYILTKNYKLTFYRKISIFTIFFLAKQFNYTFYFIKNVKIDQSDKELLFHWNEFILRGRAVEESFIINFLRYPDRTLSRFQREMEKKHNIKTKHLDRKIWSYGIKPIFFKKPVNYIEYWE